MSKTADDLAVRAAGLFREFTPAEKREYGPIVLGASRQAARKIEDSQIAWHTFRDQYCNAIALSYTTGSGAGTAMEECLYRTAADRVQQLLTDFPGLAEQREHSHSRH